MTGPIPYDRPDWLRSVATNFNILISDTAKVINAQFNSTALAVGNMRAVSVNFESLVGGTVHLFLDWYADKALTNKLARDAIDIPAGGEFIQAMTVKGPFLQFIVAANGAYPITYSLNLFESADGTVYSTIPTTPFLLNGDSIVVAAAGNLTDTSVYVQTGWAIASVWTLDAVSWNARLFSVDATGTKRALWRVQAPPGNLYSAAVFLPSTAMQFFITNNDAGNRSFGYSLVAKPFYP